jgi:TPR repeat protein
VKKIITLVFVMTILISCNKPSLEEAETFIKADKYEEALKIIRPMAEKANLRAQFKLGRMYYKGQGIAQDYKEAAKWYKKAAELGLAQAQYNLGAMYHRGQGVAQDYEEAVKWYEKAAKQGYTAGQKKLGDMYANGQGVTQDYMKAHKWINLAADKNNNYAKFRDKIEAKMTEEQILKAQANLI